MKDFLESLPSTWVTAKISDIVDVNPKLDKAEIPDNLEVAFVPMPAVEELTGRIDLTASRRFSEVKKGYTAFQEGDVLFAKITPCMENGKMAIVPTLKNGYGFGSTEFHVLRPFSGIEAKYLYYFVSSERFRAHAEHNMTGAVGQRRVPTPYLSEQRIPIAPPGEQRRIVARIEELFSKLNKGIESLTAAREKLKAYQQSVLKHAFEGKLTDDWRAARPEHQSLIGAIQAEREARLGKSAKRSRVQADPDDRFLKPQIPVRWSAECLGNLNVDIFDGPFGSHLKTSDYVENGIRVIRLENIGYGQFIDEKRSFVSNDKYQGIKRHTVVPGDIVFSSFVTDAIRSALVPRNIAFAVNKADCFGIRFFGARLNPKFAQFFLQSRSAFKQVESMIHGVGRPRINTSQLKEIVVPVCAREEQDLIVERLELAFSESNALASAIDIELSRLSSLRQAILRGAFSGQLVTQDSKDEPASAVLERIREERGDAVAKKERNDRNGKKKAA